MVRSTSGPFHSFTAVIGPNGAGKSNLMDAISFVLGVRSASLRSTALRDLIYRSGRKSGDRKGKGKAVEGEEDEEDENEEEEGSGQEQDGAVEGEEGVDGERTAWVMAVYVDREEQKEWRFQRSISTSGTSEYRLNGKAVSHKKYDEQLQRFNILVKAKNFLVFQVGLRALPSPWELGLTVACERTGRCRGRGEPEPEGPRQAHRPDQRVPLESPFPLVCRAVLICPLPHSSLDLKEEYDRCADALAKATDASVAQHSRRKGVNSEVKQYRLMSTEAARWRSLQQEKDSAIVHHVVWKLFHLEQGIRRNEESIEEKNEELKRLRSENEDVEEKVREKRKEAQRAQKDVGKQERAVKAKEKELEEARPELVTIDTKLAHAAKRLRSAEDQASKQSIDLKESEKKLESLDKDLETVNKAAERHREAQERQKKEKGISLSREDLAEYNRLKGVASTKAISEREALNALVNDDKTKRDARSSAQDQLESTQRKTERLEGEEMGLEARKEGADAKARGLQSELKKTRAELDGLRKLKVQIAQTEAEYNEKLADTLRKLQEAGAEKQEKESEKRFKETLATLKRTFQGVKGRVIDLCKPTQQKYGVAVTTVLGRNIDSIVVDTEKTAISCIEYMRVQRLGTATFLPLETIKVQPVSDKYRSIAKGARLAIDVITFDSSVEKAMQSSCGNALVCDNMQIARSICYDRGQEVKAVTLDGTVIHRAGTITGGVSHSGGRHFEDQEVEGLRRRENELKAKLAELYKSRPRPNAEEMLLTEMTRLEADLTVVQDDLTSTNTRLKGIKDELKTLRKKTKELDSTLSTLAEELSVIDAQAEAHREVIHSEEDTIFSDFCERIGVSDIREYEDKQLRGAQEDNAQMLKFNTQLARLNNQIRFQGEQVEAIRERLSTLQATADTQRASLEQLSALKEEKQAELEALEQEIEDLKQTLEELQVTLANKNAELEEVRKSGSKAAKVLDKALKEVATCNDEIERLSSEQFALYRRCKLEEIDLPLSKGSLDEIPIEEAAAPAAPMDVDGPEDGTQNVFQANDYGVEVDFDELDDNEQEDGASAMEENLLATIAKLQGEIDKMSVNLKAIERLGDSEARFKEIDAEFDQAREDAKAAKDAFTAIKKKRCDLFNKAFRHIEDRIDQVYKDLTKGKASPQGGIAYLSLEEPEEPYLHGIKYHAMPPLKRFRDMDQLSGGEKTMAALALLFAIHSFHPSPFFVLDEVDGALGICIVITHKLLMYESSHALVGIYREGGSKTLTLDLTQYGEQ
ncbi:SPOSA6832_04230 [Sporobolomyces salmonicolor]|uniref:Structural maintenance of chromosomes protein n=1 Tax=Sporidiobolus salmonicolor TaxID=5005 RepID=A0A0D6ERK7_SPOSA|nr:SPOSA6832_04230 [Sporobolomyces salmonicolor]